MSTNAANSIPPVSRSRRAIRFLFENSLFLITGAIIALVWANVDHQTYEDLLHYSPFSNSLGAKWNLHFFVNDILMALFFALATKEVFESFLPGGALSNLRTAATPLIATLGGVVMPAILYLIGAALTGQMETLGRGWAVPCATDIAFSYMVARIIFGKSHPAISFLLLLAIADDGAGLIILAIFYPQEAIQPQWLLLTLAAVGLGLTMKKQGVHNFWWYLLIPGVMSWISFYMAGIHAALGLVPIIPTMPHAAKDIGMFAPEEVSQHDTLSEFEHWWKYPVEIILGLFGLVNAGVALSNVGTGTWLVLVGLILGKPLGITLFTYVGIKMFRFQMPGDMSYRHIISLGTVAGIGFTVALFVSTAAFGQPGPIQDSVKMGALGSFLAAPLAILVSRLLNVRPMLEGTQENASADTHAQERATA
jgi:NhaA family Na+:H+ antiporter